MRIKHYLPTLAIVLAFTMAILSCNNSQPSQNEGESPTLSTIEENIAHGKYLVRAMGCNDCHSPKRMGENGPEIIPELMLSGYPSDRPIIEFDSPLIQEGFAMFYPDLTAAAGPWGISFAGNLTPDETGLGNWTEEQFKKALTQGKYKGLDNSRMLLPPMPWYNYAEMTDEDIHAVFSYLKSIQPVNNIVPQPITPNNM